MRSTQSYNYMWWDGGFRAVHNEPRPDLNPDGRVHILTPCYRLDISRDRATPVAFGPAPASGPDSLLTGLQVPDSMDPFALQLAATLAGNPYRVNHEVSAVRALAVYDAGSIAQQLRLKGIRLFDANESEHTELELELVFVCWQDLVAITVLLLQAGTRLPYEGESHLDVTWAGSQDLRPQGMTHKTGEGSLTASGNALHMHLYAGTPSGCPEVQALRLPDQIALPVSWDPLYAAHRVELDGYTGTEPYALRLKAWTEGGDAMARIVLWREGRPLMNLAGVLDPDHPQNQGKGTEFSAIAAYPVALDLGGRPNGAAWQVSTDIHEFSNYPQPYSRRWVRLYRQADVTPAKPLEEEVRLGWADSWERPAAQFCQLSLLGWDDNPHYGGKRHYRAVQLWIQGIIRQAEITCVSPDSYMVDNAITDIRPIDHSHAWGPNLGGGDFLRFRRPGTDRVGRVHAARVHFVNYGPYLGTLRVQVTGDDDLFAGEIDASILAANDLARTWFDCHYTVQCDCEMDELRVAFLGCPSYDFTALARYAWGQDNRVQHDAQLPSTGHAVSTWIEEPVVPGSWYAAYRGGIIDEQGRDPNGNRGWVIREVDLRLREMPGAVFAVRHVSTVKYHAATSQYHLHIRNRDATLRLRKGDTFHVAYEYVPYLKYHTDYGQDRNGHNPVYQALLLTHPDSYEPVPYEAQQGHWRITEVSAGSTVQPGLFPTLVISRTNAHCTLHGGSGFTPLRLVLPCRPEGLTVTDENGRNLLIEDDLAPAYQLACECGEWVATVLLRGAPTSAVAPRLQQRIHIGFILEGRDA